MKPQLEQTEFWVGTFHRSHDGTKTKVTATRDDTLALAHPAVRDGARTGQAARPHAPPITSKSKKETPFWLRKPRLS
ncbi:hypothetical protein ACIOJD_33865 [Streptomyces sp. NPDC088116]|uniref:hypothetical protein n=1 Tax=Streptomyces sp. NPDC088116 TaxID=3365825 RepID=UPI0037FF0651